MPAVRRSANLEDRRPCGLEPPVEHSPLQPPEPRHDRPLPHRHRQRPRLPRQAVGAGAALLVHPRAQHDSPRRSGLHRQGSLDRPRRAGADHQLERAPGLPLQAHQFLVRALLQRAAGEERRRILDRAQGVRGAGDVVHHRRRLSHLADAAPHHPLAALAERGLLPRLAGRSHLLPHGADPPGRGQSRAAHRAGLFQFHQADAQPHAGADPAGDDAGDVRRRALEPVERPRPARFSAALPFPAS